MEKIETFFNELTIKQYRIIISWANLFSSIVLGYFIYGLVPNWLLPILVFLFFVLGKALVITTVLAALYIPALIVGELLLGANLIYLNNICRFILWSFWWCRVDADRSIFKQYNWNSQYRVESFDDTLKLSILVEKLKTYNP